MKNIRLHSIYIISIIVIAGVSFYGGMKYQQSAISSAFANRSGSFSRGEFTGSTNSGAEGTKTFNRTAGQNKMITGTVLKKDDSSITVKQPDGSTQIFFITPDTVVNMTSTGSLADVQEGSTISAFGTASTDGSIEVRSIQIGGGTPQR